jgi:hypothetical protein
MKVVKEFWHLRYLIIIKAEFTNETARKIKGKWYHGGIVLKGEVRDELGDLLFEGLFGENRYLFGYERIGFEPTYRKFLGVKIESGVEHISDVYERKMKEFEEELKNKVKTIIKDNEIKRYEQAITDGLPDSLKEL